MFAAGNLAVNTTLDLSFLDESPAAGQEERPVRAALLVSGTDLAAPEPATLSGWESWDKPTAHRLIAQTVALIERYGVARTRSEVRDVLALLSSAEATIDPETVRFACSEFEIAVRRRRLSRT
jgi:hypothetical protein